MKILSLLSVSTLVAVGHLASAKDLEAKRASHRFAYIEQAKVWIQPAWISNNFEFDKNLDVLRGGPVKGNDKLLLQDSVVCKRTPDDIDLSGSGKTPKFKCSLMEYKDGQNTPSFVVSKKGKLDSIKVKYGIDNGETYGEVIATRLLWALGFGADRMFPMDNVFCYGCSEDPFNHPKIDASTMVQPRLFFHTAIERKMPGLSITYDNPPYSRRPGNLVPPQYTEEGWTFAELMRFLPEKNQGRRDEEIKRDALRLLAVFIQHVDSKDVNQRLVCENEDVGADGKCQGPTRLILQDVGATFGGGTLISKFRISKVELNAWRDKPIWKDAKNCRAKFGLVGDSTLTAPKISEQGRKFLSDLLVGFSSGPEGRTRVEDLFRAAKVERRDGTVREWTDAFLDKVHQIQYPMGEEHPDFRCPHTIK
jgi:hypothetical protein